MHGKIKEILEELDCGVGIDSVDRAHRIGRRMVSKDDKTQQRVFQTIIAPFSSFRDRTKDYRNRKKLDNIKIRLNLARNRLGTLE